MVLKGEPSPSQIDLRSEYYLDTQLGGELLSCLTGDLRTPRGKAAQVPIVAGREVQFDQLGGRHSVTEHVTEIKRTKQAWTDRSGRPGRSESTYARPSQHSPSRDVMVQYLTYSTSLTLLYVGLELPSYLEIDADTDTFGMQIPSRRSRASC